jgi:two-component system OmpR family response regulator
MAAKPVRVLVTEDEAGVRDLIRTRLALAGYDVHTARSGRETVARIAELRPGALVLDLNIPEGDGFQVLEWLANAGVSIPCLVVSARNHPDDVSRAVAAGAKDFLNKPFTEAQLLSRVARLLRWRVEAKPSRETVEI